MENEERDWREIDCQKEIESIKCEIAKLNPLKQALNFKNGKGMSAQPPVEALLVHT
jgi:hypothetical protein